MGLGATKKTFALLDQIVAVLDPANNDVFFWPLFESTGVLVQSYKGFDKEVIPSVAAGAKALDDAAVGFEPYLHAGGVHSYHFELGNDNCMVGADCAELSFDGSTDTAFSVGCFFYAEVATGTLIAKYDVGGSQEEWRLHLLGGPDLALEVFETTKDDSETAQCTTNLNLRQWYSGIVVYDGTGGDGMGGKTAAAGMTIYIDGAAVGATTSEVGATYADMIAGTAPLMIGASDDLAAPANEFTGRLALPFVVNTELTAAEVAAIFNIGKTLLSI